MRSGKRGPISATELMAQLQNDPEHQRKFQAAEAERQVKGHALRLTEPPIVKDLGDASLSPALEALRSEPDPSGPRRAAR